MAGIPESREVSEMHANRLSQVWADAHTPGEVASPTMFTETPKDPGILAFREDVFKTVRTNVDHGRGIAIILGERILARVRKMGGSRSGPVTFEWIPANRDAPQAWEQAAQTFLSDIAQSDYSGACEAYDYLVATTTTFVEVAQLVGAFVTANYFLRNPENAPESA